MNKKNYDEVTDRLKKIETSLAYMVKELELAKEQKPVELHYHYSISWDDYFKNINEFFNKNNMGE